jgi:hypothetical protein
MNPNEWDILVRCRSDLDHMHDELITIWSDLDYRLNESHMHQLNDEVLFVGWALDFVVRARKALEVAQGIRENGS